MDLVRVGCRYAPRNTGDSVSLEATLCCPSMSSRISPPDAAPRSPARAVSRSTTPPHPLTNPHGAAGRCATCGQHAAPHRHHRLDHPGDVASNACASIGSPSVVPVPCASTTSTWSGVSRRERLAAAIGAPTRRTDREQPGSGGIPDSALQRQQPRVTRTAGRFSGRCRHSTLIDPLMQLNHVNHLGARPKNALQ
jgi:hypothetical protein